MQGIRTIAGGIAVAGSLALFGIGSGVASAEPSVTTPQITSTQDVNQNGPVRPPTPSPYAIYGGGSLCGTPGLYFVNICT